MMNEKCGGMMRARIDRYFAMCWIVISGVIVAPPQLRAEAPAGAPSTSVVAPAADAGFTQTGIASWYGGSFHGRRTASGEIFDTHQLTAAHPTLPLGSVVEITNLENGRSTVARINDRGPFIRPRIVDCSHAVANALGFVSDGLANVRLRLLDSLRPHRVSARGKVPAEDSAPSVPAANPSLAAGVAPAHSGPKYCVQLGSFRDPSNAEVVVRRASVLPLPVFVSAVRALQQVLVGPFDDLDAAAAARRDLRLAGLAGFVRQYEASSEVALATSPAADPATIAAPAPTNAVPASPSTLSR